MTEPASKRLRLRIDFAALRGVGRRPKLPDAAVRLTASRLLRDGTGPMEAREERACR